MTDVWMSYGLIVILAICFLIRITHHQFPLLKPGHGLELVELSVIQRRYETIACHQTQFFFRIVPMAFAACFGVRLALMTPEEMGYGPSWERMLTVGTTIYVAASLFASMVRLRREKTFAINHPEFAGSVLPIGPRLRFQAPLLGAFGLLVSALNVPDNTAKIGLVAAGLATMLLVRSFQLRYLTSARFEIPWDGPLGGRVLGVIQSFGFHPKKLIFFPSLIPNAYAMADGSVMVTSALRVIATDEEIAAVIAHELSHVRDGEGKKILRLRQQSRIVPALAFGGLLAWGIMDDVRACLPAFAIFLAISLSLPMTAWVGSKTRPMEFKCDLDAAALGLGPDLASALDKLARVVGHPSRLIGWDRYLSSHPSLEERVARLTRYVAPLPEATSPDLTAL
jgi:Zn-dependent protease with chaperone function